MHVPDPVIYLHYYSIDSHRHRPLRSRLGQESGLRIPTQYPRSLLNRNLKIDSDNELLKRDLPIQWHGF